MPNPVLVWSHRLGVVSLQAQKALSVVWQLLYHLMPGLGGLLFNSSTEEPSVYYVPIQGVMGMGVFVGKLLFKAFSKEQQGLSRMGMSLVLSSSLLLE